MTRRELLAAWGAGIISAQVPKRLDLQFPDPELNFLLLDGMSREVLQDKWPKADVPIPVGSLVKPFTALAYGQPFPQLECRGAANGCWRKKPHGRLDFTEALAQSCNAYFLQLAAKVDSHNLTVVADTFGIPPPGDGSAQTRIGLGDNWKVAPRLLARAYLEITARRGDPRIDLILAGLERSAWSGTATKLGQELYGNGTRRVSDRTVLAKTGTAPCADERPHPGDGFTLALYPVTAPRIALLVRVHNVPGAEAAKTAGRMLRYLNSNR